MTTILREFSISIDSADFALVALPALGCDVYPEGNSD